MITLGGEIARLDKEIVGTILNENRCFDDLLELCYMGSRFLGTSGELLAREHIVSKLEECGLRPRIETFRHLGWRRGAARLEVLEPVRRDLVTISLAGGPSTEPKGITGELLDIGNGTPAEFERARGRLGGRIVVSTSLAPVDECTPPRQCHRRTKYGRAVEHGARAFIFMNSQPGMLPQTGSLRQDREGEVPAVTVPCEEGLLLRRLLERGPVKVRLIVENESFPNESANIVADIPGGSDDGVVLAGGHYDSHDISPGALDNGTGVVTLLELARILSYSRVELPRTIRLVFFGVEELAAVGSSHYVLRHRDELEKIGVMLNLDSPGDVGGKTFDVGGFDDLGEFILDVSEEISYPMQLRRPSFGGDQLPFIVSGVPPASMSKSSSPGMFSYRGSMNFEDRGWGHTSADTPDKLTPAQVNEGAIIAGRFLIRAALHEGEISRHRTPEEVASILRRHGMDEVLHYMRWPNIPIWPAE